MNKSQLLLKALYYYFKEETLPSNFDVNEQQLMELFNLGRIHNISPMLFQTVYNLPALSPTLKKLWKLETIGPIASQLQREHQFLNLMKLCKENNFDILVVKGIICRHLYPRSEERPSSDEDLLIRKEDMNRLSELLCAQGLTIVEDSEDVRVFHSSEGLHLEVHTELFAENSDAYGFLNKYFLNAFENTTSTNINGVEIHSLSYDQHLLFLIFHYIKHFLHGGVGIRQICDIAKFILEYQDKLDFDTLWKTLDNLNFLYLIENTLAIAACIFPQLETILPASFHKDYDSYHNLLEDIIDAGVYGKSSMERVHSSTITLHAYSDQGKVSLRHSLFPGKTTMVKRYPYLDKHPYLLPVAWLSRIFVYLRKDSTDTKVSINIGKQRVALLQQYKVIKNSNHS